MVCVGEVVVLLQLNITIAKKSIKNIFFHSSKIDEIALNKADAIFNYLIG